VEKSLDFFVSGSTKYSSSSNAYECLSYVQQPARPDVAVEVLVF